jgi:RAT1-interacting protein
VVKSGIEDVRLIMGGEVDCVEGENHLSDRLDNKSMTGVKHTIGEWTGSTECCVELKTNMVIRNERQQTNFERKLMKHWAQSYLLGIPVGVL